MQPQTKKDWQQMNDEWVIIKYDQHVSHGCLHIFLWGYWFWIDCLCYVKSKVPPAVNYLSKMIVRELTGVSMQPPLRNHISDVTRIKTGTHY